MDVLVSCNTKIIELIQHGLLIKIIDSLLLLFFCCFDMWKCTSFERVNVVTMLEEKKIWTTAVKRHRWFNGI